MNSYIWRFFKANRESPVIPALLVWAIVARLEEVAALFNQGNSAHRVVNQPVRYTQFISVLEQLIHESDVYPQHRKNANLEQLKALLPPPEAAGRSNAKTIKIETHDQAVASGSIEAIATVTCSNWLFSILENNESFARCFIDKSLTGLVFAHGSDRSRRLKRLTEYFLTDVMTVVRTTFQGHIDQRELKTVLKKANMSDLPPALVGAIKPGSREDLLARIAYVAFKLKNRFAKGIGKAFPAHLSAWSLAHVCLADDTRDMLTSNLFQVGRQSRGAGTRLLGPETRVVRDAIFTFAPWRSDGEGDREEDCPDPAVLPGVAAAYISFEGQTDYWLSGIAALPTDTSRTPQVPVWWEYSGRNASGTMKLFFFSQHVEPRHESAAEKEPRIFNAMMLGHLQAPSGDVPGVWIAVVKRLKNYRIESRRNDTRTAGFWRNCDEARTDTADINFTAECLCFHYRRDELSDILHECGIVGEIEDQEETQAALKLVLNATYGGGEDVSEVSLGYPMQLATRFFVIPKSDPRYTVVDEVFFQRKVLERAPSL